MAMPGLGGLAGRVDRAAGLMPGGASTLMSTAWAWAPISRELGDSTASARRIGAVLARICELSEKIGKGHIKARGEQAIISADHPCRVDGGRLVQLV